jgi:hypothetical protein
MRIILFILAVVTTAMCSGLASAAPPAASPTQIGKASELPKTLVEDKAFKAAPELRADVFRLLEAQKPAADVAVCSVTCAHEVGAIQCAVGKQCYCGCPGGYASCGCK